MPALDDLPADQKAVLQLVLQRGRSYDDIAALLSIDRAAVRQRALAAFDTMGPETGVAPERRALITDYLLGQLPPRVAEDTRERLADSPSERAWARVVASELAPIASQPLAEIPVESARVEQPEPIEEAIPAVEAPPFEEAPAPQEPETEVAAAGAGYLAGEAEAAPTEEEAPTLPRRRGRDRVAAEAAPAAAAAEAAPAEPRASRRGGAILLGLATVVIIVAIILIASGGSSKHTNSSTTASTPTTASTTPATSGSTTGTTTSGTSVVGQINLTSPDSGSKTAGIAEVLKQGNTDGIAIVAQHVPPNTKHDAYAVWLYNSPSDSRILGFVNPGVGSNGRLSTAGALPTNASHYKQLIVTLETQATPKQPGKVILEGNLALS